MGWFSFLNGKNGKVNAQQSSHNGLNDVPENVFIQKDEQEKSKQEDSSGFSSPDKGIELLFSFLDKNYETKGYDDALINPDSSHLAQNIEALNNELGRTIKKVKTFYEDFIKQIDFHIASRSRNGMIDMVEELSMKKDIAESHIKKVQEIEADASNNRGDSQGIIMSYTKGFKNGLSAISHHNILKTKF